MKEIILLGATGSIGTQTLDIIREYPSLFSLKAISVGTNIVKAKEIIEEFKPKMVAVKHEEDAKVLSKIYNNIEFSYGESGLVKVATYDKENSNITLVVAVVGTVGLAPTVKAIEIGRNIALANKETLVAAGDIVMKLAKEHNVTIFPIDSEHSAIYQALVGEKRENVKKLIITASGGALRNYSREELKDVTKEMALKHPNWSMGAKITIDSATMMNKGFEVIEAHHLFDIDYDKIETIIHKESIIHSLVEFNDSSVKAQMATSNMRMPILYALTYPERAKYSDELNLLERPLTFEKMDLKRYPCLALAYEAAKKGNIFPTVLTVSNDCAVKLFLEDKIPFLMIEQIVKEALEEAKYIENISLEIILKIEKELKNKILSKYERGI